MKCVLILTTLAALTNRLHFHVDSGRFMAHVVFTANDLSPRRRSCDACSDIIRSRFCRGRSSHTLWFYTLHVADAKHCCKTMPMRHCLINRTALGRSENRKLSAYRILVCFSMPRALRRGCVLFNHRMHVRSCWIGGKRQPFGCKHDAAVTPPTCMQIRALS